MDFSSELWNLTKKIVRCVFVVDSNFPVLENTNKKFEELGMHTRAELHSIYCGKIFSCNLDDRDAPLFDINFFYLFLRIFTSKSGNCICWFQDSLYIHIINEFFQVNNLPYIMRLTKDGELKLYEVTLKEYSFKL